MKQKIKERIEQIKNGIVPNGYKKTPVGVCPIEWRQIILSNVFDFKNGLNKEKEAFGTGTPIVNYIDVYKKRGLFFKSLSGKVELNKNEISNYIVQKGDMFFTRTSETIKEIGFSSVMLDECFDTVYSGFVLRARPKNNILVIEFNKYCFSTMAMRNEITKKSSYTTRALTNGTFLGQVNLNVPSSFEQKKIAEILGTWDNAIELQEKKIEKLQEKKKALMQKNLNSNDYEKMSIQEMLDDNYFRLVKPKELNQYSGDKIYLSTSSIIKDQIVSNEGFYKYDERPSRAQMKPIKNSVWFAKMENSIKVLLAYKDFENNFILSTGFYGFLPTNKVFPQFLKQVFLSEYFNKQKDIYAEGSSQNGIKDKNLADIFIFVPDYNGQVLIANLLQEFDKILSLEQQLLEKYKEQKKSLMQLLLTGIVRVV